MGNSSAKDKQESPVNTPTKDNVSFTDEGGENESGQTTTSELTKIVFSQGLEETLHGSLEPGKDVQIVYDGHRLPNRDYHCGERAWSIWVEVKYFEDGAVHAQELDGPDDEEVMTTTLQIPADATSFIIWFKHWGRYNGYSYDSNNSTSYKFPFDQIVFTDNWNNYVKGALHPGKKFQVMYDSVRLPWRDMGYNGLGYAWNIFANAKFKENGKVVEKMFPGGSQGGNPIMTTIFDIPEDADEVIMWFKFSGYVHTQEWDSNQGNNYHFGVTHD